MFESFLVTFREGMEAFLIVFIMMAYLAKTGHKALIKPIYFGIGGAVLTSLGMAYAIENFIPSAELTEGLMAMVAAVLVITLTVHMLKAAKTIKNTITNAIDRHTAKEGFAAVAGVFLFTLLMITREGMEVVLFIGALSYEVAASRLILGALCGLAAAIALGFTWIKYSHLINLPRFLQVTAIFLILFSGHLFLYGFHEMTEANEVPFIDNDYWHIATESLAEGDSLGSQLIAYSMLIIPLAWLGFAILKDRRKLASRSA